MSLMRTKLRLIINIMQNILHSKPKTTNILGRNALVFIYLESESPIFQKMKNRAFNFSNQAIYCVIIALNVLATLFVFTVIK